MHPSADSGSVCIDVRHVSFRYRQRVALDDVSLTVQPGEIFGLLGPNGGGKTTLFRLLSTYFPLQSGSITIDGIDLASQPMRVRQIIGVVFQHPSLDGKLTVAENLKHHARMYGVPASERLAKSESLLRQVGLWDRRDDVVERLSGGLARRAELAKGMLHDPRLLILDEPSTGLDPGARRDLWQYLKLLQSEKKVTSLLTTHLMEEAERCDRLAILSRGKVLAIGTPDELRQSIGGEMVTIRCADPARVAQRLQTTTDIQPTILDDCIRFESKEPYRLVPQLPELVGERIDSLEISKPTLEDVFIRLTGHRFWAEEQLQDASN